MKSYSHTILNEKGNIKNWTVKIRAIRTIPDTRLGNTLVNPLPPRVLFGDTVATPVESHVLFEWSHTPSN